MREFFVFDLSVGDRIDLARNFVGPVSTDFETVENFVFDADDGSTYAIGAIERDSDCREPRARVGFIADEQAGYDARGAFVGPVVEVGDAYVDRQAALYAFALAAIDAA